MLESNCSVQCGQSISSYFFHRNLKLMTHCTIVKSHDGITKPLAINHTLFQTHFNITVGKVLEAFWTLSDKPFC